MNPDNPMNPHTLPATAARAGRRGRSRADFSMVGTSAAHAVIVREQAGVRREAAVAAGSQVEDYEVHRLDASGSMVTLERRYVRDRIDGEAAALDQRADQLEAAAVSYRDVLLGEPPAAEPTPEFRHPDAAASWRADRERAARRREAAVVGQREQLGTTVATILGEEQSS